MDARRAANLLGIPFYVWDFSERFAADVVDDFVAEYAAGRTPNPCMRCNERIKFAALLEKALALGFDAVATGHYATILTDARRQPRAAPQRRLGQGPVVRARGAHRRAARARDVPARRDPVEGRGARRGRRPRADGRPEARQPRHLLHPGWRHPRLARRSRRCRDGRDPRPRRRPHRHPRRSAPPSPSASARASTSASRPTTASRASCSRCARRPTRSSSGRREALAIAELAGSRFSWAGMPPADPETPFDCEVQVRAHARPGSRRCAAGRATASSIDRHPPRARSIGVAPGQTAVIYVGTRVLGQCTIDRTVSAVPVALPVVTARACRSGSVN